MDTPRNKDIFATTHWSVVLRAGSAETEPALKALTDLCRTYWYPIYSYARHRGYRPHDAEDVTQGFFAKLLRLESIKSVSPEKGRFRAFLLASLKNYMGEEWQRSSAAKRDVRKTLSLDAETAEARFVLEPKDTLSPDRLYDRQWAMTLLETVMNRLSQEYERSGRAEVFDALRFSIAGEKSDVPYRELAPRLGMKEEAIRVAVFRLRQAYRKILKEEISHTVAEPGDVDKELCELRRILSR